MIAKSRSGVRALVVSVPAMFRAISIIDYAIVMGTFRAFEKILHEIHRVVEIVVVHRAAVEVNFSLDFWA